MSVDNDKPALPPEDQPSRVRPRIDEADFEDAATEPMATRLPALPARANEVLVELAIRAGQLDTPEAIIDDAVGRLADLWPSFAVGACMPREGAVGQHIVRRYPVSHDAEEERVEPNRLFPTWVAERISEIPRDELGTTLHVAAGSVDALAGEQAVAPVLAKAAPIIAMALERVRESCALSAAMDRARELGEQAAQAERLAGFGELAAGVVHELNNPLTAIVAYANQLAQLAKTPDRTLDDSHLEFVERIRVSAERMLGYTRDLMRYARPSDRVPVEVGISTVVDQALVFCEHLVGEASVVIERKFASDAMPVLGVPEQLVQVFVNVLTNACHALPKDGGRIVIESMRVEHRMLVRVRDNGYGIAEAERERVFSAFYTTKPPGKGTGLGLSIVRSIVERHGGTVALESHVNVGTTLTIELPVAPR